MKTLSAVAAIFLSALGSDAILAADDHLDVSKVIDKATAESAIGEAVKPAAARNVEGKDGYYSKCNYYSATSSKALVLRVYQAAPGLDPSKEMDGVRASTGAPKSVSGLGDKAQIYDGPESGLPNNVVMLYVVKGNSLVTVGLSGMDDEISLDKTKRLAQKIVAAIP